MPAPAVLTTRSWTFECSPHSEGLFRLDHSGQGRDSWQWPEGDTTPEIVRERIMRLVDDEFDSGGCEANCCAATLPARPNGPSPSAVGYHLSGDADQYMDWKWACIVIVPAYRDTPEQAIVVCEDCDPGTIYLGRSVSGG